MKKLLQKLFGKRDLSEAFHPVADPAKNVRLFHFLVTPYSEDALQYSRIHKYDLKDCRIIQTEENLLGSRPPRDSLKIHYLRGWEKLPQEVLARLRIIESKL